MPTNDLFPICDIIMLRRWEKQGRVKYKVKTDISRKNGLLEIQTSIKKKTRTAQRVEVFASGVQKNSGFWFISLSAL